MCKRDGLKREREIGRRSARDTPSARSTSKVPKAEHIPSRSSFGRPLNITETPDPRPLIRLETYDNNTAKDPLQR
jgi:hypothetical protein